MPTLANEILLDVFASRPAFGSGGRLFFASDTGAAYRDSGTAWELIPIASQSGEFVNAQTGTSYTVLSGDLGNLITFSNGSAIAATLPRALGVFPGGFGDGWFIDVRNLGAGTVTITPTTSTINGVSTLVLVTGESARIVSDGANYQITGLIRTTFAESAVTGLVSDLAAKAPTSRLINTTAPLTGGGALSADRTLAISVFGASGGGHSPGAVPDPGSSAGTSKFLREDATFAIPPGGLAKYTTSWSSQTSVTVTHGLATTAVIVQVFDGSGVLVIPESVTVTSSSVVTLTFGAAFTGSVVVIG